MFALSLRVSVWDLLSWDARAWEGVRGILPDGLAQGSSAPLPITPSAHPAFAALLADTGPVDPPSHLRVVSVGRLVPKKGFDVLLDALRRLLDRREPDYRN